MKFECPLSFYLIAMPIGFLHSPDTPYSVGYAREERSISNTPLLPTPSTPKTPLAH